jgi:hypothetical protein
VFFLEGIELFSIPSQLVYTRQIADPMVGGKVTGKFGRLGLAYPNSVDDKPDGGHALFNIARVRTDFGASSLAGITYTDRTAADGANRVLAAETRVTFKKLYYVQGRLGGSWDEVAGKTTSAPLWGAEFDRTGRKTGLPVPPVNH